MLRAEVKESVRLLLGSNRRSFAKNAGTQILGAPTRIWEVERNIEIEAEEHYIHRKSFNCVILDMQHFMLDARKTIEVSLEGFDMRVSSGVLLLEPKGFTLFSGHTTVNTHCTHGFCMKARSVPHAFMNFHS